MSDSLPRPARISAIEMESALSRTLVLDAALEAEPGQFVMLWLPRLDEKPFSLVESDPLTITIACVGPFTRVAHSLKIGDQLWWRGPFGRGFRIRGRRLLLAGGGYGAAPLVFLARRARIEGCEVVMIVGARTSGELLLTRQGELQNPGVAEVAVGGYPDELNPRRARDVRAHQPHGCDNGEHGQRVARGMTLHDTPSW